MSATLQATATQAVAITASPLGFEPGPTPAIWFGGNPFLTHFMNAFSGILPEGERFMIDSVRQARSGLPWDHALQADISGFIGQEAFHAREHRLVNERAQGQGVPVDRLEAVAARVIARLQALPERDRMAITGATEHLTALFGELVLRHPEVVELVHPELRPLFVWHALEELEHKAVAFDLYELLDGDYGRRVLGQLRASAMILGLVLYGQLLFLREDGSIRNIRAMAKGLWWMFGVGREAGYFRRALPGYLAFFRPGFHPLQDDSADLVAAWRPRLAAMLDRR